MSMQKLLIVDDQPEIRKMLRIALSGKNFQLFEAANGEEALTHLHAEHPDIVLLDVMMPGIYSGLDVCRIIKGEPELAKTFVVMLTARGQPGDYSAGDLAGADAYMVKPCTLARLIQIIETHQHPGRPVFAHHG